MVYRPRDVSVRRSWPESNDLWSFEERHPRTVEHDIEGKAALGGGNGGPERAGHVARGTMPSIPPHFEPYAVGTGPGRDLSPWQTGSGSPRDKVRVHPGVKAQSLLNAKTTSGTAKIISGTA